MDEKLLVKKAKSGDKTAFSSLYRLYKDKLYRYAFYRLGNSDDAQDAVSDAVLSAFEQIRNLRNAESFSYWIFRILNITCSKYIKRQIDNRELALLDDYDNKKSLSCELNTVSIELKQGLDILNEEERQIVLLSIVAGLNSKEISSITDLTPGSVRSKQSRAISKMRSFLEG